MTNEGCDFFFPVGYAKINQPYLEDGESMTTFLLIAILVMTGWIMITLNEIDKTSSEHNLELYKKIENLQKQLDER